MIKQTPELNISLDLKAILLKGFVGTELFGFLRDHPDQQEAIAGIILKALHDYTEKLADEIASDADQMPPDYDSLITKGVILILANAIGYELLKSNLDDEEQLNLMSFREKLIMSEFGLSEKDFGGN